MNRKCMHHRSTADCPIVTSTVCLELKSVLVVYDDVESKSCAASQFIGLCVVLEFNQRFGGFAALILVILRKNSIHVTHIYMDDAML